MKQKENEPMFIYVMDVESKDKLLQLGYTLLKDNGNGSIWVFVNKEGQQFDSLDVPCVVSDVLTF